VTIFSCPNYCYRCGNDACIMEVDERGQHEMLVFYQAQDQQGLKRKVMPDYFL
jgi:serine/threonine-protein phosphatase 2A catalytic subunit